MVRQILSLGTEVQLHYFRQLKSFAQAKVQLHKLGPTKHVTTESSKAHEAWTRGWIRRGAGKRGSPSPTGCNGRRATSLSRLHPSPVSGDGGRRVASTVCRRCDGSTEDWL